MKKRQQAGMTLIELVIVIIVLGIIAAVAAPKFADIKSGAATSANLGSIGAVDSAYTIAVAAAQGTPTEAQFSAKISGMTCTVAGCNTGDADADGANDVAVAFYSSNCATATATGAGDSVTAYEFTVNGAAGDCREF